MRIATGLLAGTLVILSCCNVRAEAPKPGEQIACELKVKTGDNAEVKTIHYWLFVPADYDKKAEWPLMLFLHGAGERGSDLELVKTWGPPKIVGENKAFPFVLISPQCPKGIRWETDLLLELVDHVANTCQVDKNRIYVTGLSMGGYGTWGLLAKYPKIFAAAAPICGAGDPAAAAKMTHVPIWAFHGDADHTVPVERSKEMVDAVKKAGGDVRLTIYPGVGHNSWSATYANQELYRWLLSHQRAHK